jgi:hypothetical protein
LTNRPPGIKFNSRRLVISIFQKEGKISMFRKKEKFEAVPCDFETETSRIKSTTIVRDVEKGPDKGFVNIDFNWSKAKTNGLSDFRITLEGDKELVEWLQRNILLKRRD